MSRLLLVNFYNLGTILKLLLDLMFDLGTSAPVPQVVW